MSNASPACTMRRAPPSISISTWPDRAYALMVVLAGRSAATG
jgi:hypothetical protein